MAHRTPAHREHAIGTRLLAFGNNACGNLHPTCREVILPAPTDVSEATACRDILWAGWSCSIGRDAAGEARSWGLGQYPFSATVQRVIGLDSPAGYLDSQGRFHTFDGDISKDSWDDVVVVGSGIVYACKEGAGLYRFPSMACLLRNEEARPITHHIFTPNTPRRLYATENRAFVQTAGSLPHLCEIIDDHVSIIDEFEGLGLRFVTAGTANRLAVVTDGGDAYLPHRNAPIELIDLDEPVEMVGIGSRFEIVVTQQSVWVRGQNNYSQLGLEGTAEDFVRHPGLSSIAERIQSVHCSRWASFVAVS